MSHTTTTVRVQESRPTLGHVNLMVDTFIDNASPDDLRVALRTFLASGIAPGMGSAFAAVARNRLRQKSAQKAFVQSPLFEVIGDLEQQKIQPTSNLPEALLRVRALYGSGLALASLTGLTSIVQEITEKIRDPESDPEISRICSDIDSDITQAIQSVKEEVSNGRVNDWQWAHGEVRVLHDAVKASSTKMASHGLRCPFEQALLCLKFLKLPVVSR